MVLRPKLLGREPTKSGQPTIVYSVLYSIPLQYEYCCTRKRALPHVVLAAHVRGPELHGPLGSLRAGDAETQVQRAVYSWRVPDACRTSRTHRRDPEREEVARQASRHAVLSCPTLSHPNTPYFNVLRTLTANSRFHNCSFP